MRTTANHSAARVTVNQAATRTTVNDSATMATTSYAAVTVPSTHNSFAKTPGNQSQRPQKKDIRGKYSSLNQLGLALLCL